MDFSKMKMSDKIIGLGGLIGIVAALLPWYSWTVNASLFGVPAGGGTSVNGLNGWWVLSFVAAVIAFLMVLLPMLGVKIPKLGIEESLQYMILGAVAGGIPVLVLLTGASNSSLTFGLGSAGPSIGLFLAMAGGTLILYGGWSLQKDGKKSV